MKVKTASVVYDRKFNLGNYNSLQLGVTLWADLDDGEDESAVTQQLQDQAREFVKREFARLQSTPKGGEEAA